MQGRIGFLLIPFLCSRCNIIPQTRFVNPDFPISQFLHIFSTLPYIPSVSGVLCGSDCAVQQSQSSHNVIHSVDSVRLAEAIDQEAEKKGIVMPVLVELFLSNLLRLILQLEGTDRYSQ